MISFKQYLLEAMDTRTGNYVSVACKVPKELTDLKVQTGTKSKDYHITLVYSKESSANKDAVKKALESNFKSSGIAKIIKAAKFDSQEDAGKSCIVLKLESKQLNAMNKALTSFADIKHSYPNYEAHVTLFYDVVTDEAEYWVNWINEQSDYIGEFLQWSKFE